MSVTDSLCLDYGQVVLTLKSNNESPSLTCLTRSHRVWGECVCGYQAQSHSRKDAKDASVVKSMVRLGFDALEQMRV